MPHTGYMTRTDIHRPSAPEFDPETYQCVGVFDMDSEWGNNAYRVDTVNRFLAQGYSFAGAPHGSRQCSHCGTHIRYAALMLHEATSTMLYVGETCLDNRFESLTKAEFQSLREAAKLNRERTARGDKIDLLLAEHPVLAWASYANNIDAPGADWELSTLNDIWFKVSRYADPSAKQITFVARLVEKVTAKVEEQASRDAEKAALSAAGVQVPAGRITVEGTVFSTKWVDSQYGGSLKMLVQADEGWKVWGTVPSSISVEKNSRVRFTATVEQSNDDRLFGFFKRPSKAEVVEVAA